MCLCVAGRQTGLIPASTKTPNSFHPQGTKNPSRSGREANKPTQTFPQTHCGRRNGRIPILDWGILRRCESCPLHLMHPKPSANLGGCWNVNETMNASDQRVGSVKTVCVDYPENGSIEPRPMEKMCMPIPGAMLPDPDFSCFAVRLLSPPQHG